MTTIIQFDYRTQSRLRLYDVLANKLPEAYKTTMAQLTDQEKLGFVHYCRNNYARTIRTIFGIYTYYKNSEQYIYTDINQLIQILEGKKKHSFRYLSELKNSGLIGKLPDKKSILIKSAKRQLKNLEHIKEVKEKFDTIKSRLDNLIDDFPNLNTIRLEKDLIIAIISCHQIVPNLAKYCECFPDSNNLHKRIKRYMSRAKMKA